MYKCNIYLKKCNKVKAMNLNKLCSKFELDIKKISFQDHLSISNHVHEVVCVCVCVFTLQVSHYSDEAKKINK